MTEAQQPPAMSRTLAVVYAIGLPLACVALVFVPVGRLDWAPGWWFLGILVGAFLVSAAVLARVNPVIYRARSRFQPGTQGWDKALLLAMLPAMVAIIPLATLDAGRMHWSTVPGWGVALGYAALLAGIAGSAWPQAVNPFFEPGVRIQSERHQRVIDTGPYRFVRHPGYVAALLLFAGMALALGSLWALLPAAFAGALLVVRTGWEDALLHRELPGYADYARRVRWRLAPGIW